MPAVILTPSHLAGCEIISSLPPKDGAPAYHVVRTPHGDVTTAVQDSTHTLLTTRQLAVFRRELGTAPESGDVPLALDAALTGGKASVKVTVRLPVELAARYSAIVGTGNTASSLREHIRDRVRTSG